MTCDAVQAALRVFEICTETQHGSRITTHCLYPSFEPVEVYVHQFGDGFRVHDGGGARREAWLHGVEDALMTRLLNQEATRHQIEAEGHALVATAETPDWLFAAVTAVANASAHAARHAIDNLEPPGEEALANVIGRILTSIFPERMVKKDHPFRGKSGKEHHFNYALRGRGGRSILIDGVTPHHFSISSRYTAFADSRIDGFENVGRFAVYDRALGDADAKLLSQVAEVLPVRAIALGAQRWMTRTGWSEAPLITSLRP